MTNEMNIGGAFSFGVQDVASGGVVNINNIFARSLQYNDLLKDITLQKKLLALTPQTDTNEIIQINNELKSLEDQLEQFKSDVIRLAEQFDRIEINTARLKNAKEYFDKGAIKEAKAVLESEFEQMKSEQEQLLEKKAEFDQEILPKLKDNADEFLMLAMLSISDYDNPNRFTDSDNYFKLSVKSLETKENLFQYATFLTLVSRNTEAGNLFGYLLENYENKLTPDEKINTYNNVGLLLWKLNDFTNAEYHLNKALEILKENYEENTPFYNYTIATTNVNLGVIAHYRPSADGTLTNYETAKTKYLAAKDAFIELAKSDYKTYQPQVIGLINNLGFLYTKIGKFDEAENSFIEAENKVDEYFVEIGLLLPTLLIDINLNRGNLWFAQKDYAKAKEYYDTASGVCVEFSKENPSFYLEKRMFLLNAKSVVKKVEGNLKEAAEMLEESIAELTEPMKNEPFTYRICYCIALVNLSVIYQEMNQNRERSIAFAARTIAYLNPIIDTATYTLEYYNYAVGVINAWGLTKEEAEAAIQKEVDLVENAVN
ncbi:MAG TPA: tetratricopeptide repeat protein [Pyrinomonadaceae bacterium]|nr:tetratricopeptide repeat protein [Pyrinomonadaceae bacterium]